MIQYILRERRQSLGLSQSEISTLAHISLPNIQRIESGTISPTLKTTESVCAALGLKISIGAEPFCWSDLIQLGLPLSDEKSHSKSSDVRTWLKLKSMLSLACQNLLLYVGQEDSDRIREAVQGLLYAIETHYPSHFKQLSRLAVIKEFKKKSKKSNRIPKLRRIALAEISKYL